MEKESLIQKFLIENLNVRECAQFFNCSSDCITYWCHKYGLKKSADQKRAVISKAQKYRANIKHTIDELRDILPKERFIEEFIDKNQTLDSICSKFKIEPSEFNRLKKEYKINKSQKLACSARLITLGWKTISEAEKELDRDDLYHYYVDENHTQLETQEHFHISEATFNQLRIRWNLQKPKESQVELTLKTKGIQSPKDFCEHIDTDQFAKDFSDLPLLTLSEKYDIGVSGIYKVADFLNLPVKHNPSDSKPNINFETLLKQHNLKYSREFSSCYSYKPRRFFKYDFRAQSILYEINPTISHCPILSWGGDNSSISEDYHQRKSKWAEKIGMRCIHIWDWDDPQKIIEISSEPENIIYARNCNVREITTHELNQFLNQYHLQGSCHGVKIALGLFKGGDLLQVMSFGTPRYSKKYDWELLRLCTKHSYGIIGGSEKLFMYFDRLYTPKNIVSYCDKSKFSGKIYEKLGFTLLRWNKPSKHWYNIKTKQHITDNLLRQRGFDQLFGTSFGKGTSNEELMLEAGFLPIFDAGQATYVWEEK